MWQPTKKQWRLIWPLAIFVLLAWPVENGSLAVKAVRWLADPSGTLPQLPGPLAMGLDDNADAVAVHDAEEAEYFRLAASSGLAHARLRMKELNDPFDQTDRAPVARWNRGDWRLLVWYGGLEFWAGP
jgi:hypothetical protein